MTDLLLQVGLSNACVSLALAVLATVVGAAVRRPHLANLLWLLVLAKLVTPPVVTIPVVTIPRQVDTAIALQGRSGPGLPVATGRERDVSRPGPPIAGGHVFGVSRPGPQPANHHEPRVGERQGTSLSARIGAAVFAHGRGWLPPIWLLGSALVLVWSLVRVFRFGRLLAAESEAAPQQLHAAAARIARRLGLKTIPTIRTTSACLSPMVWWAGGRVRIVIPATLLDQMDARQWQWILAHELAHVRRRDHLVRWLEWLACVCFWWNPVVWWARRNLRASEELCCDALVLSRLAPERRTYAKSLLTAVEFLGGPVVRPPAMASEINSGGFLERRFKMIVSGTPNRPSSRWLRVCVLLCAAMVLPFGVARAQDYEAVEKRLRKAVRKGEITLEHAGAMMAALRKAAKAEDGRDRGERDRARADAHLREVWEGLQAAVKAGKMSQEDANRKMGAIKREVYSRLKDSGGRARADAHLREAWEGLQAAVKAGKMPQEDANRKMAAIKREVHPRLKDSRDRARADAHLREVWEELQAAVKAGKMSQEDANRKMAAIKKEVLAKVGENGGTEKDDWLASIGARLKAAVAKGEMTEEEAWAKWYQVKEQIVAPRLKAAVAKGEMTEAKAWAIWQEIEKAEAAERPKSKNDAPVADLLTAARNGDIRAIKRHLSAGANVNAKGEAGVTPLFVAAVFGRAEAAKLLIEGGANVKAAKGEDGSTALHAAAFFCHTETVELLLAKGADINAVNQRSETPLDTVAGPWSEGLGEFYAAVAKAIEMKLDLGRVQATRPKIAALLRKHGGKTGGEPRKTPPPSKKPVRPPEHAAALGLRGSYAVNGQIHVGTFGKPEGKPLTTGHQDMKPSWSKTGDMLVFFRLVQYAPRIPDWRTAICIVKTDGTGFRKLTDGTHTDFNPTWTRDGTNLAVFNRQNRKTGGYWVMFTRHDARPGDEYAVSDTRIHTYAYSCLKDGRLLVSASGRPGYFLMTPGRDNGAKYEPLQCELARTGSLDRVSISPGETKVCFELQRGFGEYRYPGRVLYIADFDAKARTITNPKAIANESADRDATFLYPRWTRDESAVVYHHGRGGRNQLYMHLLADGSTTRVSTDPGANYMFPHGEKSPK